MGEKSSKYYSSQGIITPPANTNLVLGHPSNYSDAAKFYKNLSLAVKSGCRVQINDSVIHVDPALGLNLTNDNNEVIKYFAILDSNIPIYYIGSW